MGLKKAVKKAAKHIVSGTKAFISDPTSKEGLESGAGLMLTPATGGISLAATADAGRRTENKLEEEARRAQRQADLVEANIQKYGFGSLSELATARKKKQQELEERGEGEVTGLASLIGKGKTLG